MLQPFLQGFAAISQGHLLLDMATLAGLNLNSQVSLKARSKGILVNAVDQPADCNFIVPSIIRQGDLTIAISTGGRSPAMARKIRKDLENQFGSAYKELLAFMGRLRKQILLQGYPQHENSRIFNAIVETDILDAFQRKDLSRIETIVRSNVPFDIDVRALF